MLTKMDQMSESGVYSSGYTLKASTTAAVHATLRDERFTHSCCFCLAPYCWRLTHWNIHRHSQCNPISVNVMIPLKEARPETYFLLHLATCTHPYIFKSSDLPRSSVPAWACSVRGGKDTLYMPRSTLFHVQKKSIQADAQCFFCVCFSVTLEQTPAIQYWNNPSQIKAVSMTGKTNLKDVVYCISP